MVSKTDWHQRDKFHCSKGQKQVELFYKTAMIWAPNSKGLGKDDRSRNRREDYYTNELSDLEDSIL